MTGGWRITTINGLILAAYLVPTWVISAFRIVIHPMRGIYERGNVGLVTYVSDAFQFSAVGVVRVAWLLVLAKFVVVAFLLVFSVQTFRGGARHRTDGDEALALALMLGGIVSVASMLAASSVGEGESVRMHATEALMLIGGFVLFVIDSQSYGPERQDDVLADVPLTVAKPAI